MLQTDARGMGIGAVLEQGNRVVTLPEKSYGVIQQECEAIVYALKLGCHFTLQTNHAPLQFHDYNFMTHLDLMGPLSRTLLEEISRCIIGSGDKL